MKREAGSFELSKIGGLYAGRPVLAGLFLVSAFSLAGFPPLSGFWAKYVLLVASLDLQLWVVAAVILIVGLMTIYSMTKIWGRAFWKPHPTGAVPSLSMIPLAQRMAMIVPVAALALMTVVIGLVPQPFLDIAERVAAELLDPMSYVTAVLGPLEGRP